MVFIIRKTGRHCYWAKNRLQDNSRLGQTMEVRLPHINQERQLKEATPKKAELEVTAGNFPFRVLNYRSRGKKPLLSVFQVCGSH